MELSINIFFISCIYVIIYSKRKIQSFLRNNTALIFKFIYIHPFIKSIKLQLIHKKYFQLKYGQCISPVLYRIFSTSKTW